MRASLLLCLPLSCLGFVSSVTRRDLLSAVQGQRRRVALTRAPSMIISPEAMVVVQKTVNKAAFERTVENYMRVKRMSREAAELEYAKYLLDPDAYVLEKAAEDVFGEKRGRKTGPRVAIKPAEPGQRRSPLLQAYIDEGGDEVRERIEAFERTNTIKALVIISVLSGLLIGKDFLPEGIIPH